MPAAKRQLFAKGTVIIGHPSYPNEAAKRLTFEPGQPLVDEKGQPLALDDEQVTRLVRGGHVEDPAAGVRAMPQQPTPPKAKGERIAAITAAAQHLDPKSEDQFTASGKPSTAALGEALGWPVSADERDEAWAAANKTK